MPSIQLVLSMLFTTARVAVDVVWTIITRFSWEQRAIWVFFATLLFLVIVLVRVRLLDLRVLGRWLENHLLTILAVAFWVSFFTAIVMGVKEGGLPERMVVITVALGVVTIVRAMRERLRGV